MLKNTLNLYERTSGQAINYDRPGIYFSSNVTPEARENLKGILGIFNPLNTGKYLGLSLLIRRSKVHISSTLEIVYGVDSNFGGERGAFEINCSVNPDILYEHCEGKYVR